MPATAVTDGDATVTEGREERDSPTGQNGHSRTGRNRASGPAGRVPGGAAPTGGPPRGPSGAPEDGVEEETYVLVTLRIVGMPA